MAFIEQNTQVSHRESMFTLKAVFKSRSFVELSEDTLHAVLQSDNLQVG